MARRFTLCVTLLSWLVATGTQWDVMQVFAWGRMVVVYSQNMTLGEALQLTFSPEGQCALCRLVGEGRSEESQRAAAAGTAEKREVKALPVAPVRNEARVVVAVTAVGPADEVTWSSHERASPPSPPPRAGGVV